MQKLIRLFDRNKLCVCCKQEMLTWPGRGDLVLLHGKPVVARAPLLLELAPERRGDVPEPEGAHSGPGDGVGRGPEHAIHHRVHLVPVDTLQHGE